MKTLLKKTVFALTALVAVSLTLTGCEDEHKIKAEKLPEATRTFISQYFSGLDIVTAYKDRDDGVISYDVRLSDGTEIDFDEAGTWTSVDCNLSPVPDGIVPEPILTHLGTYVEGGTQVFKIERILGGYEVKIADGRELIYGSDGTFVRVDSDR